MGFRSVKICWKNWLESSKSKGENQWINQHNKIHASFGCTIIILEQKFNDKNLYTQLVSNILRAELNFIYHEIVWGGKTSTYSSKCGCFYEVKTWKTCICMSEVYMHYQLIWGIGVNPFQTLHTSLGQVYLCLLCIW